MPRTKPQTEQLKNISAQIELGSAANAGLDTLIDSISQSFRTPLRLFASATPDAVLNISASLVQSGNSSGKIVSPLVTTTPTFVASTINFQTGATTGGTFSATFPSTTVGQFRRAAFTLMSTGTMNVTFSAAVASLGSLADPGTLYTSGGLPVGYVDLEATASTAFKTAGSATSVIENAVSGTSRIINVVGGGGGGSASTAVSSSYVRSGKPAVSNGVTFIDITFSSAVTDTNYAPVCSWIYTGAGNPQFQPFVISNITMTGFRVSWNAATDEATYLMSYHTMGLA